VLRSRLIRVLPPEIVVGTLVGDLVLRSRLIRVLPPETLVGDLVLRSRLIRVLPPETLVGDLVLRPRLIRALPPEIVVGTLLGDFVLRLVLRSPVPSLAPSLIRPLSTELVARTLIGSLVRDIVLRSRLIRALFGPPLVGALADPLVGKRRLPRLRITLFGPFGLLGSKFGELRVRSLVGSAIRPAVADLLVRLSADVGPIAGFAVVSTCSVPRAKPSRGTSEDGRLVGAALDRLMGPSAVPKTGIVFGLSIVNAAGAKVGSDDTTSTTKRFTGTLGMSPELPMNKTVITAAETTIAMAAIVTLVAIDISFFPVAAVAIVPAPVAADVPLLAAAWTAID
jgi:hypothetical protein